MQLIISKIEDRFNTCFGYRIINCETGRSYKYYRESVSNGDVYPENVIVHDKDDIEILTDCPEEGIAAFPILDKFGELAYSNRDSLKLTVFGRCNIGDTKLFRVANPKGELSVIEESSLYAMEKGATVVICNRFNGELIGVEEVKELGLLEEIYEHRARNKLMGRSVPNIVIDAEGEVILTGFEGNLEENIVIPDYVTIIGEEAMGEANNVAGIKLGKNVHTIENKAFHGCTGLERIELNEGLLNMGSEIFYDSLCLKELVVPKSVEHIAQHVGMRAETLVVKSTNLDTRQMGTTTYKWMEWIKNVEYGKLILSRDANCKILRYLLEGYPNTQFEVE